MEQKHLADINAITDSNTTHNQTNTQNMTPLTTELVILKKIMNHDRLIRIVKFSLTNLIQKLIIEIGFDKTSFFSDNHTRFGNIGHVIGNLDLEQKLGYLLSDNATVREKVSAITNSVVNGSDAQGKNKKNTKLLYEYIMMRKDTHITSSKKSWIHRRAEQLNDMDSSGALINIDSAHLWAPIYLLYHGYKTKHDNTKIFLNNESHFNSTFHGITRADLVEPLSKYEEKFLGDNSCAHNRLPMMTGKFIYKDIKHKIPDTMGRDDSLIIGGLSGHTILLMELALLLDVKWIPILFACIISQTPHHHSVAEIVDALKEMDMICQNRVYDRTKYIYHIYELANSIDVQLND